MTGSRPLTALWLPACSFRPHCTPRSTHPPESARDSSVITLSRGDVFCDHVLTATALFPKLLAVLRRNHESRSTNADGQTGWGPLWAGRIVKSQLPSTASVERAQFSPHVLDLGDIVLAGLDLDAEAQIRRGQMAGRGDHRERRDCFAGGCLDQALLHCCQFGLGVEHV